jgi:hypothetical protein
MRWFLFLLCALSTTASAELYRFVDESGRVHYTNKPPKSATRVDMPQDRVQAPAQRAPSSSVSGPVPLPPPLPPSILGTSLPPPPPVDASPVGKLQEQLEKQKPSTESKP